MIKLFTNQDFFMAKTKDKLLLQCVHCSKSFLLAKREILSAINGGKATCEYCSKKCKDKSSVTILEEHCTNCQTLFKIRPSQYKKSKNHFCCKSCAAIYNNKHKTKGSTRSKLEVWLEKQLALLYPSLLIEFNSKTAIQSELDIYIPSLKLAFELNGVYHYEPIYGADKLKRTQVNDANKFQACITNHINLCLIDVSGQVYFKERTSKKYLDIIKQIIDKEVALQRVEL